MKTPTTIRSLGITGLFLLSVHAVAADAVQGKSLHDTHCTGCHISIMGGGDGTTIYTRKNRRVVSLQGLENQVQRCKNNLNIPLSEDQISALIEYLNSQFYKFPG